MRRSPALTACLVTGALALLVGCSSHPSASSTRAPIARRPSSSPAPLAVPVAERLFEQLVTSCTDKLDAFTAVVATHHHIYGPEFAGERSAAAAYATTCGKTVDAFLDDRWPIDPLAFHLDADDLEVTVRLMARFSIGDIPDDWLRELTAADHQFGTDIRVLEFDIGPAQ